MDLIQLSFKSLHCVLLFDTKTQKLFSAYLFSHIMLLLSTKSKIIVMKKDKEVANMGWIQYEMGAVIFYR